ncbi:MAG: glycosyltransferase family 4 protein, partial [Solirubrobacteraceae bacterium]
MYQTIDWMRKEGFRCVWIAFYQEKNRRTTITTNEDTSCIFHTYGGFPSQDRLEAVYSVYRPDIIHLQGPIIYLALPIFKKYRLPLLIGFHFWTGLLKVTEEGFKNRDMLSHLDELALDPICQEVGGNKEFYVASDFINQIITGLGGQPISNIIYPIPPNNHYKPGVELPLLERKYITCININRGKGGDIFLAIIKKIKDLPFLAICNEPNPDDLDDQIRSEINGEVLTYSDVRDIYGQTRLLLIPSHVDETFSRVAYEGAANGIPIITSGNGFIKQLLGEAGFYLSPDPEDWIDTIREIYHDEKFLLRQSKQLQEKVSKLGDQKPKFLSIIHRLLPKSLKRNIMLLVPWCDQGLGHQAKTYSRLLQREGFHVHIFSYLSYFCLDQKDKFRQDPEEWLDYTSLYETYNTREEITERELRQFVICHDIGLALIPEICFNPIFDKVKILKNLNVECYAIPNIETCRRDELSKYGLFDKILCNTRQCYRVLGQEGVPNLVYIGHCLPDVPHAPHNREIAYSGGRTLKFLHVSGYNALSRKQTMTILQAFREARRILDGHIELT